MGRHPDPGPSVITDRPGTLGREIIANQHFHRSWSVPGVLVRYARGWLQLPAEHHGELGIVDQAGQFMPAERVEAVLVLITNHLPGMREAARSERSEQRTEWSFDPFQQWSVICLPEDRLLIIDPRHLISRAFGWLPIWDIEFPPSGRTKPTATAWPPGPRRPCATAVSCTSAKSST
ncbi:hypothetical protein [Streptomyces chryseus]